MGRKMKIMPISSADNVQRLLTEVLISQGTSSLATLSDSINNKGYQKIAERKKKQKPDIKKRIQGFQPQRTFLLIK